MPNRDDIGRGAIDRARTWLGRFTAPEAPRGKRAALIALLALTGLAIVANAAIGPAAFPVSTIVVPLVFGGLLLEPRPLLVLIVAVMAVLVAENAGVGDNVVHPGSYVVTIIVAGI